MPPPYRHIEVLQILQKHARGLTLDQIMAEAQKNPGSEVPTDKQTASKLLFTLKGNGSVDRVEYNSTSKYKITAMGREALAEWEKTQNSAGQIPAQPDNEVMIDQPATKQDPETTPEIQQAIDQLLRAAAATRLPAIQNRPQKLDLLTVLANSFDQLDLAGYADLLKDTITDLLNHTQETPHETNTATN